MADPHDRWVAERRSDHYHKFAKKPNHRSRASFEHIQIDERFGIFKPGDAVVVLGRARVAGCRWPRSAPGPTAGSSAWT